MLKILKHSIKFSNSQKNLFLFLEELRLKFLFLEELRLKNIKNKKKLSIKEIYNNKLIISNLLKDHNYNSVNLDDKNIAMYLIQYFNFFKYFFDKKDLQKIIDECKINHQDKYGRSVILYILRFNKDQELGFTRDDIVFLLGKIDLNHQDDYKWSVILYILKFNKNQELGFTRDDIIPLLEKIDLKLKQNNSLGWNIAMFIFKYNKGEELGFTKDDVLNLLDRFDLSQKTRDKISIYDFILDKNLNTVGLFTQQEMSFLISKLDIEMTDKDNNNILIKELKNGLCFDSEELVEKILNTENKDIINCVYQHIDQIAWKQDKLLLFLKKNEFKIDDAGCKLL